ncbi:hypothetical protein CKAH01_16211 [Colletotrichum kahawae]|uniref:Ankyrin repeat protein n=1 Tax=Colletotrichum kahawae TaxID=34407 RepID=A0AAD9YF48_COLKA|nr:hypothetical protein CKAH01_16211 [Colletotrichum kahawae]
MSDAEEAPSLASSAVIVVVEALNEPDVPPNGPDLAARHSPGSSNKSSHHGEDVTLQLAELKALNEKHSQIIKLLQNRFDIPVDISETAARLLSNVRDGWKRLDTSPFQAQIYHVIDLWANDWDKTLNQLSAPISIENEKELERLMYDSDLKKTRTYFKVLQTLRIFSDIIEAAEVDFEWYSGFCSGGRFQEVRGRSFREEELVINHNWATLKAFHQEKGKKLLFKISAMRKEIESLRDGLFNAQSVREAQKSRELNKIMMVFTIVTILFLPPTFVVTFFGVEVFHAASDVQTRKIFWTARAVLNKYGFGKDMNGESRTRLDN